MKVLNKNIFSNCVCRLWCLFLLLINCGLSEEQQLLSPCPRVFQYQHDGQQWYGVVQVRSPPFGTKLMMNIKMSIGVRLPTRYVGRVEMLGDRVEIIQEMLSGGIIKYKVHFPLFSPLPVPTLITFNRQVLCQGPPARGGYITTINLDHSLSTETINSVGVPAGIPTQRPNTDTNEVSLNRPNTQNNPNDPLAGYEIEEYELMPTADGNFVVIYKQKPNPDTFARPSVVDGSVVLGTSTTTTTTTRVPPTEAPSDYEDVFYPIKPSPIPTLAPTPSPIPTPAPTPSPSQVTYQCGVPFQTPNPLVVSGESVERGEWPWIVAIFTKKINGLEYICGGTLISPKHVVTAAHCVHEKNNRPVKVNEIVLRIGVHNIHDWTDEISKTRSAVTIELHPDFNANQVLNTDIAVLVLTRDVTYNQYIIPVCLWQGNTDQTEIVGRRGAVVGWGRDENGLRATPEPRKADIPIVSTDTCRASRVEFQLFTNNKTLCAGERNGSGPCNGDSGGGLYMRREGRWVLRGIVSNSLKDPESFNTCNLHEYVIFTDVAKYNSWIRGLLNA